MKERIKQIRKNSKSTQKTFAESLGLSQNFIAQVESGTKNVSDRTIKDICRTFNVNEEWLRTGNGEVYNQPSNEIGDIVSSLIEESNPLYDLIFEIVKYYSTLDNASKSAINNLIDGIMSNKNKD